MSEEAHALDQFTVPTEIKQHISVFKFKFTLFNGISHMDTGHYKIILDGLLGIPSIAQINPIFSRTINSARCVYIWGPETPKRDLNKTIWLPHYLMIQKILSLMHLLFNGYLIVT